MTLARTNSKPGLFQIDSAKLAQQLVQHVVYGELDEVEKLLLVNPALALIPCVVTDYSGREIVANAFRASLGAVNPKMWKMIETYIKQDKGAGADDVIRAEFKAQYPHGVLKPNFYEQGRVVTGEGLYDFHEIVNAINEVSDEEIADFIAHADDQHFQSRLSAPFAKFRQYFSLGKIESGFHFNAQDLRNAFNIYNHFGDEIGVELKSRPFGKYCSEFDSVDQKLFFCMVIGYIERLVPAHYAHAFCQGLSDLIDSYDGEPEIERSLEFKYSNKNKARYYPLDQDSQAKLGYQVACDYMGGLPKNECVYLGGGDGGTPWMLRLEVFDIQNLHELWKLSESLGLDNVISSQNRI